MSEYSQTYIFYGSVVPERANCLISPRSLLSSDYTLHIQCLSSKIIVETISFNADINIETLKNIVEHHVRIIVDSIGYTLACGYDVEIDSAYSPNTKETWIFGTHEDIFDKEEINFSTDRGTPHPEVPVTADALAALSVKTLQLSIALSDFREAIRQPSFTAFHCYRAIEALMQEFDGKNKVEQWVKMRASLKVAQETIEKIRTVSKALRHGQIIEQPWEVRKEHMYITWEIIRRYIMLKTYPSKLDELSFF